LGARVHRERAPARLHPSSAWSRPHRCSSNPCVESCSPADGCSRFRTAGAWSVQRSGQTGPATAPDRALTAWHEKCSRGRLTFARLRTRSDPP
jgi:hypothetical protein